MRQGEHYTHEELKEMGAKLLPTPMAQNFNNFIHDSRIFLTGGTGTLGRAILRMATADRWPCQFTVFSRDPAKQIALKRQFPRVRFVLGDIRDYERLYLAMAGHDIVIHAAAQKHINWGEDHPDETVSINVMGTGNVIQAAIANDVKQVVGISTDKACYPTNIYGATKLAMERLFSQANGHGPTFHLCRYGNVLGSTGSVIPLWEEQAKRSRCLTVTDPEMTRFWLSEWQAVELVKAALAMPPGSVSIPLAPAMRIGEMARALFPECELEVIGSRPGEKADECLMTVEESYLAWNVRGLLVLCEGKPVGDAEKAMLAGYFSHKPERWLSGTEMRLMARGVAK